MKTVTKPKAKKDSLTNAVRKYIRSGYAPVPIPGGKKAPTIRGWQKLRLSEAEIFEYFQATNNLGLLLGKPSSGLVDIDIDTPQAAVVADIFLPPTEMVHGRKSKPASHRWYRVGNAPAPQKFSDVDGSCLIETRSTGQQTVIPPSVHPSGERLRWENQGPPKKLKAEELRRAVSLAATAALLARHWPDEGSRNDTSMALAGMVLRAGWSVEKTANFVRAVARAAGDEEWRERVASVRSTAKRISQNGKTTGAPRLAELVGKEVVAKIQQWLDLPDGNTDPEAAHLTDLGNAQRFAGQHGKKIRFCHNWKKWLIWDRTRWAEDETGRVERKAKRTVRKLYEEAGQEADDESRKELGKWARVSESRGRIMAMIDLAKSEPRIPILP
jgi:putative DNA primase/helicase